ncbi:heterokaryon incompatibility protein-domain-containing protein [Nemania abortiva]|nr:heterokaryon incompatibility protein-domain-containing protein [Nemania abortiva]
MAFPYPGLPGGDALRLLTLEPGRFFDSLQGTLTPVPFSAKPKYLALSYTWDDPTPYQSAFPVDFVAKQQPEWSLDDEDGSVYVSPESCRGEATLALGGHDMPLRHNLALALRYLRSTSQPLTLWVDAVCINQDDIVERNAQVALMASIYSRAAAVVTWLGLNRTGFWGLGETSDANYSLEAGADMRSSYLRGNSKMLAPWFAEHIAAKSGPRNRDILESRAAEKEALERMTVVNKLGNAMVIKTTYWERVWVVQEVCLAQKVFFVYGPTVFVDTETVQSAHQKNGLKVASGMTRMLEARDARFSNAMRLETLIEKFTAQMCTDPRDKIYGLVGLANDVNPVENLGDSGVLAPQNDNGDNVDFIIDYRRSFYDIWCDTIQYLFRCPYYFVPAHLDLDKDELRRLRHERLTNLVRFSGLVQNTLQDEVERELARLTSAFWTDKPNVHLLGPELFPRHLVPARGYVAGKIVDLGPTYADFVGSSRHQTVWKTKCRKHYRKEFDLEKLRQMEERYAAKILDYDETDVARITLIDGENFVAFASEEDGPLDNITTSPTRDNRGAIMDDIMSKRPTNSVPIPLREGQVCRFLGTNLCMGLVPPETAVGDWVIRFWDCDAAIVVRPEEASDPKSSCALVGRADVADVWDRKGPLGDNMANTALSRNSYGSSEDRRIDMVMSWHTLQRITASIIT